MMPSDSLPTTAIDYFQHERSSRALKAPGSESFKAPWSATALPVESTPINQISLLNEPSVDEDPEFKLPRLKSLFVVIAGNCFFQASFFIIVSSASVYAEHLGGTATFSGLTIGIPTAFSGLALLFVVNYDGGGYTRPMNIAYLSVILGNILYALAYKANWLYLILIGRMVSGVGFTAFLFSKRYCSDPHIVGIRRRTTLAGWLVVGQCFGFTVGPFIGGVLYKIGFSNPVFNGFTSPGWVTAGIFAVFACVSRVLFTDVPKDPSTSGSFELQDMTRYSPGPNRNVMGALRTLTRRQWGVVVCMCYYSFTCFFILGAWESNIPVFSAVALGYSPYNAGNFLALGGIATFPFLLINVRFARRLQDRITLATGSALGLSGLLIMLSILRADKITFGSFYVCWFLVALGFNLASTCTLSLLSKQMPDTLNGQLSMAIQYSNYTGRVTGAILGGAGVEMGMTNYIGVQIAVVCLGGLMHMTLWKQLKAKTG